MEKTYAIEKDGETVIVAAVDCCQAFNRGTGMALGYAHGFFFKNRTIENGVRKVIYGHNNGQAYSVTGPMKSQTS